MAPASPLVLIIHAFGGNPRKFWYEQLAAALRDTCVHTDSSTLGAGDGMGEEGVPAAEVEVLRMTEAHAPTIDNWVGDVRRRVRQAEGGPPRELYLLGHSVGCQTIIRFLAEPDAATLLSQASLRLRGCLCVAAWFAVVDPWPSIEPWCSTPIDTEAARRVLTSGGDCPLRLLLSDNDKYTPDYEGTAAAFRERLGAEEAVVVPGRAHFGGRNQPEVLAAAQAMLLPKKAQRPQLPSELLALTLGCLDARSLGRASAVSTAWRDAASGDSAGGKGAWALLLPRDYPAVPSPHDAAAARFVYRLAAATQTCGRCHKAYRVGHNTAVACGYHSGVIISGHRDNGMRARWTCCGKWGPTRAGGTTELVPAEFCCFGRHLGPPASLSTPEEVGACGASGAGGVARHVRHLLHTAGDPRASTLRSVDGSSAASASQPTAGGVRDTLVGEMMHARSVAAEQGVSWL